MFFLKPNIIGSIFGSAHGITLNLSLPSLGKCSLNRFLQISWSQSFSSTQSSLCSMSIFTPILRKMLHSCLNLFFSFCFVIFLIYQRFSILLPQQHHPLGTLFFTKSKDFGVKKRQTFFPMLVFALAPASKTLPEHISHKPFQPTWSAPTGPRKINHPFLTRGLSATLDHL